MWSRCEVTVRMLLNHTSGMRAYRAYFKLAQSRTEAVQLIYEEPLQRTPGTRAVYSDINAILLGLLVEAVAGEPLDVFVAREVFQPLGMTDSYFALPGAERARAVPTGRWRGHPVGGVVNDQNAVVLDGVAGHAGVFAPGRDLARYAQWWLQHGTADGVAVVRRGTMLEFLNFCQLLLVAGNETTTNLISNAILAFDAFPQEVHKLRGNT